MAKATIGRLSRRIRNTATDVLAGLDLDEKILRTILQNRAHFKAGMRDLLTRLSTPGFWSEYDFVREMIESRGGTFITPEMITAACPSIVYGEQELFDLRRTMPGPDDFSGMMNYWGEHRLLIVPGPPRPMSLLDMFGLVPNLFRVQKSPEGWSWKPRLWQDEPFARTDKVTCRWLPLCKWSPRDNMHSKTWSEQQEKLSEWEVTPNAAELVWGMIVSHLCSRDVNAPCLRVSSVESCGRHASVYFSDDGQVVIDVADDAAEEGDDSRWDNLELATAWKPK